MEIHTKMEKWFTAILMTICFSAHAECVEMRLDECIRVGIENNLEIKNSSENIRLAELTLSENRYKLLPVIEAFGSFTNNVDKGATVGKTSLMGTEPSPDANWMQSVGMRYNTTGGIQMTMPLYDQTIYTGIDIAKKTRELRKLQYDQARERLIIEIAKLYYLAQTTQEQIGLANENLDRLNKLQDITQALLDNGAILLDDKERVDYQLEDARVQKSKLESLLTQQINLLKFWMNLSPEQDICVTRLEFVEPDRNSDAPLNYDLPELQALRKQQEIQTAQIKQIKQGYLPSLSFRGQLGYTKYEEHFSDYFHSNTPRSWYNSFYWGLTLKVPIFDGFHKHTSIKKSTVNLTMLQNDYENMVSNLETKHRNSLTRLYSDIDTYNRQYANYLLAKDIYVTTKDKYKEGVSSMTDLLRDETNITSAQNSYVNAYYSYQLTRLDLLQLNGELETLVNNKK